MASKLNNNFSDNGNIPSIISSDKFGEYDAEMQREILKKMDESQKRDGGLMGKLFGNKKELASMNIAVFICSILLLICAIDVIHSICTNGEIHMNLITTMIPVVSLALGFVFGKGESNK